MAVLLLVFTVFPTLIATAFGDLPQLSRSAELGNVSYCSRDYSCLNCSAVRVCAPTPDGQNLFETTRFTCPSTNPYCNYASGSCSSSPDPACYDTPNTTVTTNFTCMRDGYFPDPSNCSLYYYCQNEIAYQYTCTYPLPYYHPGLKSCSSSRYYCTDYSSSYYCGYSQYRGRKIPISYTRNYFIYCGVNSDYLAVDRCIGGYYFDRDAQACLFTCPNEGLFPKSDDCANYFKCSPQPGGGYILTDKTCPLGQGFLESEYSCVDRSMVPNCHKSYTDLFSK